LPIIPMKEMKLQAFGRLVLIVWLKIKGRVQQWDK